MLLLSRWLDRFGSRPVMLGTGLFCAASMLGWISIAVAALPVSVPVVLLLMFSMGLGGAAVNLAITRLAMAAVPEVGRSHYFAVYSVTGSVVLGLSPILWGALVDFLRTIDPLVLLGMKWDPFATLFAGFAACFLLTSAAAWRVEEPESAPLDQLLRQAMSRSRLRFWIRLWPRQ